MQRIYIIIILLLGFTLGMNGQHLQQSTPEEAIHQANRYHAETYGESSPQEFSLFSLDSAGNTILYELIYGNRHILISGSKVCTPIIGDFYYPNGSVLEIYNDLPIHIREFFNQYIDEIVFCFSNDTIGLNHQNFWTNSIHSTRENTVVYPLLVTKWGQAGCNTGSSVGYNYYAPPDTSNICEHCLAGCVAVAVAQVMNYWQFPVIYFTQNGQFDWCNMSVGLDDGSSTFLKNRHAIACLLASVGKEVEMEYGCQGSQSTIQKSLSALVNSYGYNEAAEVIYRRDYSESNWIAMIKTELLMSRPVIYRGKNNDGGHEFVVDGFNTSNLFHINWGWKGLYDGFFRLNELYPGDDSYNDSQQAIINLYPSETTDICDLAFDLTTFYAIVYSNSQLLGIPSYSITPSTLTVLKSADINSPEEWRTIPSGVSADYVAHKEVILRSGFTVERGADFVARIEPCAYCENNNREETMAENPMANAPTIITDEEYSYPTISASFDAGIDTLSVYSSKEFFTLTPNPTDGKVSVEVKSDKLKDKSGVATITVCDATGRKVLKQKASTLNSQFSTLNLEALPAGTYFVTVTIGGQSGTRKLVVK